MVEDMAFKVGGLNGVTFVVGIVFGGLGIIGVLLGSFAIRRGYEPSMIQQNVYNLGTVRA